MWNTEQGDKVVLSITCQGLRDLQANLLGNRGKHTTKTTEEETEHHREKEIAETAVTQNYPNNLQKLTPPMATLK